MRILLLGATGRTGKLILRIATAKGYDVNCLVRYPDKIKINDRILIFKGNPTKINDLKNAADGCEAIITALNISRKSDFPWAKLITPKTFLSDVITNIIDLSRQSNIKRLIVCSAWGVAETKKDLPYWFRWFIDNSNISAAYSNHERQEDILKKSDLNWTIVRPSGLTNTKKLQKISESYQNIPKPNLTISRQSVAKYMVDSLENENLIKKIVVISKK